MRNCDVYGYGCGIDEDTLVDAEIQESRSRGNGHERRDIGYYRRDR